MNLDKLMDKEWRMANLYTIVDKNQKRITFKRNKAQEHFNKHKHSRNIVLKSRQLGFTTYEAVDMLDDSLFNKNFEGLFIAHTQNDAKDIFDKKIDFAWRNLDENIKALYKVIHDSANRLKFELGNNIQSGIMVSNSGRSGTYNRVHISEYAKLCATYPIKANEILSGTIPAVPIDGRIDIESTAEGMGGHFADMFWNALNRKGDPLMTEFKAFFYNWQYDEAEIQKVDIIPFDRMEDAHRFIDYQKLHALTDLEISYYYLKWLEVQKDWDRLRQEYPTTPHEAFIVSGSPYFDTEKLTEYMIRARDIESELGILEGNVFTPMPRGNVTVWEKPISTGSYTIGGDTSEGIEGIEGGDFSVLIVIDNKTLRTVAKFKDRVRPDELSKIAFDLGTWYNNAYIGVEVNKDGLWVNAELHKMGYPNLYYREAYDSTLQKVSPKLGFRTDSKTRPFILSELRRMISEHSNIWNNIGFLEEGLVFIRNSSGVPSAQSGKNDDEVMATAIAYEIRQNMPEAFEDAQEISTTNQLVLARLERLYGKKDKVSIGQNKYV